MQPAPFQRRVSAHNSTDVAIYVVVVLLVNTLNILFVSKILLITPTSPPIPLQSNLSNWMFCFPFISWIFCRFFHFSVYLFRFCGFLSIRFFIKFINQFQNIYSLLIFMLRALNGCVCVNNRFYLIKPVQWNETIMCSFKLLWFEYPMILWKHFVCCIILPPMPA